MKKISAVLSLDICAKTIQCWRCLLHDGKTLTKPESTQEDPTHRNTAHTEQLARLSARLLVRVLPSCSLPHPQILYVNNLAV